MRFIANRAKEKAKERAEARTQINKTQCEREREREKCGGEKRLPLLRVAHYES